MATVTPTMTPISAADALRFYQGDISNGAEFDPYWNLYGDPPDDRSWWIDANGQPTPSALEWFARARAGGNQAAADQAAQDKDGFLGGLGKPLLLGGLALGGLGMAGYGPLAGAFGGGAAGYGALSGPELAAMIESGTVGAAGAGIEGLAGIGAAAPGFSLANIFGGGGGSGGALGSGLNPWINLGANALNSYLGYRGVQNAADIVRQGADANRAAIEPWRVAGVGALNELTGRMPELTRRFTLADFTADPGYQFRVSEGMKGLDRAAAARGLWNSGKQMKALNRFNQDYASNEFSNAYNRFRLDNSDVFNKYSMLAGLGQTATGQLINQNAGAANALGAAQIAGAGQIQGGVNNVLGTMQQNDVLNRVLAASGRQSMYPTVG